MTLPKGESAEEIGRLMQLIGEDKAFVVTIETLRGLEALDAIVQVLRPGRDALGFGVGPLFADDRFNGPAAAPFLYREDVERLNPEAVWNALS